MTSIIINSDPSKNQRTDYTHVTVDNLEPFPWKFLSRQQTLSSLTVIGFKPYLWEFVGQETLSSPNMVESTPEIPFTAAQPRVILSTVKRLYLDNCNHYGVRLIMSAAPNAEYIEIIRCNHDTIEVSSEHLRVLRIRECTHIQDVTVRCGELKTIYIDETFSGTTDINVAGCRKLERIQYNKRVVPINITSDPSENQRTDYTHATVNNLDEFPWRFLSRQHSLNSLTVIGSYSVRGRSDRPRAIFPMVKRLHLDNCGFDSSMYDIDGVSMIMLTVPNAEYIEISRAGPAISVRSEQVRVLRIHQCTHTQSVEVCCNKVKIIHVDDPLPELRRLTVSTCPELESIPIHFRDCENLQEMHIDTCPMITSVKTLCDELNHLGQLAIINCPLLCDLPLIHPDAARKCKVTLRGCALITMDAIPVPWRLIKNKANIYLGAAVTPVDPVAFKKVLKDRRWDRRMHANAGEEINARIASLLLGLQRRQLDDIMPDIDPEMSEEIVNQMPIEDFRAKAADTAAAKTAAADARAVRTAAAAAAATADADAAAADAEELHHHLDTQDTRPAKRKNKRR